MTSRQVALAPGLEVCFTGLEPRLLAAVERFLEPLLEAGAVAGGAPLVISGEPPPLAESAAGSRRRPRAAPRRERFSRLAGPSNPTSAFLAALGEVHGLDTSEEARENEALASFSRLDDEASFPHEEGAFDACVSNYVLEHVSDPASHFREIARVLEPGGVYLLRTPNSLHYVSLGARLTPHWLHKLLANRMRALPRGAHEPYPTFYRANSRRSIRRLADLSGLRVVELRMVEKEPSYAMRSRVLFLALTGYERLVNATHYLSGLRSNIFGVLRKPSSC